MCGKYLLWFYINEIPGAKDLGSQEILILAPAGGRKLSDDIYIFIPSLALRNSVMRFSGKQGKQHHRLK